MTSEAVSPTLYEILTFKARKWLVFPTSLFFDAPAVVEWYEAGLCDREVAGSTPTRGCCVPTPTQSAIPPGSVNE